MQYYQTPIHQILHRMVMKYNMVRILLYGTQALPYFVISWQQTQRLMAILRLVVMTMVLMTSPYNGTLIVKMTMTGQNSLYYFIMLLMKTTSCNKLKFASQVEYLL